MTNRFRISQTIERLLIFAVLAAVVLSVWNLRPRQIQQPEDVEQLEGWYCLRDGKRVDVTLPCTLNLEDGADLVLYNDSLTASDTSKALTTRGAVYRVRILLGDQVLYAYEDSDFPRNEQMRSKLDCTATLGENPENRTLSLVYQNPGDGCFEVPSVYLGSSSAILRRQVANDSFTIAMVFTMVLFGVIALGIYLYLLAVRMPEPRFANVACSLFICAAWCALDSSLAQQLSGMSPAVCYLSFYAFMTLAVPTIHFVRNTGQMRRFRSLDVCLFLFYLNAVVQCLLNFFGIFSFIDMLAVTHMLLSGGTVLVTVLMLREYEKTRQREILSALTAVAILAAGGLLAIVLYWLLKVHYYGAIFELGILIHIIWLLCILVNSTVNNLRFKTEAAVYQRLSQEDCLTGLANRRSFDEYMTSLETAPNTEGNTALIFLDLNGLKHVNDQFGHNVGDELIIAAARCIEGTFSEMGTCFRIGGDEFAVILPNPPGTPEDWQNLLEESVRRHNQMARHQLSIACGASLLRDEHGQTKRLSDWKYEADQSMYACKQRQMKSPSTGGWAEEAKHDGI